MRSPVCCMPPPGIISEASLALAPPGGQGGNRARRTAPQARTLTMTVQSSTNPNKAFWEAISLVGLLLLILLVSVLHPGGWLGRGQKAGGREPAPTVPSQPLGDDGAGVPPSSEEQPPPKNRPRGEPPERNNPPGPPSDDGGDSDPNVNTRINPIFSLAAQGTGPEIELVLPQDGDTYDVEVIRDPNPPTGQDHPQHGLPQPLPPQWPHPPPPPFPPNPNLPPLHPHPPPPHPPPLQPHLFPHPPRSAPLPAPHHVGPFGPHQQGTGPFGAPPPGFQGVPQGVSTEVPISGPPLGPPPLGPPSVPPRERGFDWQQLPPHGPMGPGDPLRVYLADVPPIPPSGIRIPTTSGLSELGPVVSGFDGLLISPEDTDRTEDKAPFVGWIPSLFERYSGHNPTAGV